MKIQQRTVTVRELVAGYADNQDGGVVGLSGMLDVRPPYQREFVYKDAQRAAVIDTVTKHFPLNVLYWADRGDGTFEVMDGQQRIISISQYVTSVFARDFKYFHNLTQDEKDVILDYELTVYVCTGTESDKLEWFKTINIAGEKLTDQELRNAVYSGTWLAEAKKRFSRTGGPAAQLAGDYLKGSPIRQDYLETTLGWIADRDALAVSSGSSGSSGAGGAAGSSVAIEDYMAAHQHDADADDLWSYFQKVISWVKITFPTYRREMKGIAWGELYNVHHSTAVNATLFDAAVTRLMADDDVTKKSGIFSYLLSRRERDLSIRSFSPNQKREAFERQQGICPACDQVFEIGEMEADHVTPWSAGGKTTADNCMMLCKDDNRKKSGK